jgi:hypothetical protein
MYKWMGHVWSRLLIVFRRCLVKENTISGTLGHVKPGENHAVVAHCFGATKCILFIECRARIGQGAINKLLRTFSHNCQRRGKIHFLDPFRMFDKIVDAVLLYIEQIKTFHVVVPVIAGGFNWH